MAPTSSSDSTPRKPPKSVSFISLYRPPPGEHPRRRRRRTDHSQANHPTPQTSAVSSTAPSPPSTGLSTSHLHVAPSVSVACFPLRFRSSRTFPFHPKGRSTPRRQNPLRPLMPPPRKAHLHPSPRKHRSGTQDSTSGHLAQRAPLARRST